MITSGNGIVPDFLAETKQPEQVKAGMTAPASNGDGKPYVPKTDRQATIKERLSVWIMGGVVGLLSILFVASRIYPHPHNVQPGSPLDGNKNAAQASQHAPANGPSILPITDAGRPQADTNDKSSLAGEDIARTAKQRSQPSIQSSTASNLSGIAPFNNQQQPWEAAPFQPNAPSSASEQPTEVAETRNERDGLDKPSLVFVRNTAASSGRKAQDSRADIDFGVGLPPGTRLRARLESAVSTAVSTPVVAVVEYNYERHGEIIVPAGARVFGHLEAADASGYVGVRFESVLMPDSSSVNLDAAATDLRLRPLRGKVEGRHRGKNILVRSASGIGEIAATLAGRSSINQPLSEGDMLRERVSSNIAQASDEEVNKLAVTEHLVVSVAANTEIYVVLRKPAKTEPQAKADPTAASSSPANARQNADQLRQLLQLQRELNQEAVAGSSNQ
jgi:hypothetical protein